MTRRARPIAVRTTEQYWALLFTMSSSRFSISLRGVGSHGSLSTDRVSNLYPDSVNDVSNRKGKRALTPVGHQILGCHSRRHSLIFLNSFLLILVAVVLFDKSGR